MTGEPKQTSRKLEGIRVGILVAPGFEEEEVKLPRRALGAAGAATSLVAPVPSRVRSWHGKDWGPEFSVDMLVEEAGRASFDALLLPGGVLSSDALRGNEAARAVVRRAMDDNKPVAAICHGPWLLIDTETARGRKVTSHPRIAKDLQNAGASWFDASVVVDGNLVTSRSPEDLEAFNEQMLEIFGNASEGRSAVTP